jgi:hypothetical protein
MTLKIASIHPASNAEWDTIWTDCYYSTFFHSREWAEIWDSYTHGALTPSPRKVAFSDGAEVILPFVRQRIAKGVFYQYQSSPGGTFGGWISTATLTPSHCELLVDQFSKYCDLIIRHNPYFPGYDALANSSFNRMQKDETHVLDLSLGFDQVLKHWKKERLRGVRKAEKEGVQVTAAKSEKDWQQYYSAYQDSLARWGDSATSNYSWLLFKQLYERHSANIKLWIAIRERKIIAGVLCFYSKRHAVYWHGATFRDCLRFQPVSLLMHESIRDACAQGYAWYDFNPSGGHEGVKKMKEAYGGVAVPCPTYYFNSPLVRAYSYVTNIIKQTRIA